MYDYDPYGKKLSEASQSADDTEEDDEYNNPFRYCGEYTDHESGFTYLRARFYAPNISRFISEDTYQGVATDTLSLNRYTYCEGDPVNGVDPSGHMSEAIQGLVTGLTGLGLSDVWNPVGWALLIAAAVILVGAAAYDICQDYYNKITQTAEGLGRIAGGYGNLRCKEAAKAMQGYLKKRNEHGSIITITFIGGRGYIWSELTSQVISENGVHVEIQYKGFVFCNVHPYGLPKRQWINDFHGTGEKRLYQKYLSDLRYY